MSHRFLTALFTVIAVVLLVPPAAAQPADSSAVPRTAWGKPDLRGVWDFATLTPMERPAALAGKEFLTDEDVATIVAQSAQTTQFLSENRGATGTYDEFWFDFGTNVSADRRTSLVVDPPDGKVPPLTEAAQQRMAARQAYLRDHSADSWEDRNIGERCILGFNSGPPMIPSAYNNVFQLFQTPDHVVILNEMVHDARIVALDDSAHLPPHMRQWHGDSRGHWDGDTLVVETINVTGYQVNTSIPHIPLYFFRESGITSMCRIAPIRFVTLSEKTIGCVGTWSGRSATGRRWNVSATGCAVRTSG